MTAGSATRRPRPPSPCGREPPRRRPWSSASRATSCQLASAGPASARCGAWPRSARRWRRPRAWPAAPDSSPVLGSSSVSNIGRSGPAGTFAGGSFRRPERAPTGIRDAGTAPRSGQPRRRRCPVVEVVGSAILQGSARWLRHHRS